MSDGRKNYQADKEKLRMAKNLVKSNNKKIKKALQEIHDFKILYAEQLAKFSCENSPRYEKLLKEIVKTLS